MCPHAYIFFVCGFAKKNAIIAGTRLRAFIRYFALIYRPFFYFLFLLLEFAEGHGKGRGFRDRP